MKTKIEIKDIYGNVLFAHECEDNSVKKTLEEAVRQRANLRGANLGGANLHDANLGDADLGGADLHGAYLHDANLRYAYLHGANLHGANLGGANLDGANLGGANLGDANLHGANLHGADLRYAYLHGANLRDADLGGADLHGADLHDANLGGANLHGANLRDAKNIPFIPLACPSDGAFIGWKKVRDCLVKLLIPEDAKRCSATTNKCRCDKAKVLEITSMETNEHLDEITNTKYAPCVYKVGKMVYPDSFDNDRWDKCSHGIHFFINRQEAVEY